MRCPNCGARMNKQAGVCLKCGTKLSQIQTASHQAVKQARAEYEPEKVVYTTMWPKDLSCRNTLLFCIFLGLFGAHYFYVKRPIPGTIFCVGWSIFLLFYIIAASLTYGDGGGFPVFEGDLQIVAVFISIIGALVFVYWIADIIRIAFKRFKVPVVLQTK